MPDRIRVCQLTYDGVACVQIVVTSEDSTVVRYIMKLGDWSKALGKPGVDVETIREAAMVVT